jgi:hypothetical protein
MAQLEPVDVIWSPALVLLRLLTDDKRAVFPKWSHAGAHRQKLGRGRVRAYPDLGVFCLLSFDDICPLWGTTSDDH